MSQYKSLELRYLQTYLQSSVHIDDIVELVPVHDELTHLPASVVGNIRRHQEFAIWFGAVRQHFFHHGNILFLRLSSVVNGLVLEIHRIHPRDSSVQQFHELSVNIIDDLSVFDYAVTTYTRHAFVNLKYVK